MKTPEEYAEELVEKYWKSAKINHELAIECALIDVQNTIDGCRKVLGMEKDEWFNGLEFNPNQWHRQRFT